MDALLAMTAEVPADSNWILALVALAAMEIVLGIDNIVFIAIVTGRLPKQQQPSARLLGLAAALIMRILLLLSISWILQMKEDVILLTSLGVPDSWFEGLEHAGVGGDPLVQLCLGCFLLRIDLFFQCL